MSESQQDTNLISDGYHTFGELYEHRFELYLALCRQLVRTKSVWRSKVHSDGTSYDGWFILGIDYAPGSQITYHLPMKYWDRTDFVHTPVHIPQFDGHTSFDVIERLKCL